MKDSDLIREIEYIIFRNINNGKYSTADDVYNLAREIYDSVYYKIYEYAYQDGYGEGYNDGKDTQ